MEKIEDEQTIKYIEDKLNEANSEIKKKAEMMVLKNPKA